MKPLNKTERSGAFLRFLVFFLITIALVITVVFFSIEVPYNESERLRQKVAALQKESETSASFNELMKEAMDEMNKFAVTEESPKAVSQRVQYKIEKMEGLVRQIPDYNYTIYPLIIRNLSDLNTAKFRLSQANSR